MYRYSVNEREKEHFCIGSKDIEEEERPWWPIQSPNKGRRKKVKGDKIKSIDLRCEKWQVVRFRKRRIIKQDVKVFGKGIWKSLQFPLKETLSTSQQNAVPTLYSKIEEIVF